ncbi:hypothetical protein HY632_04880 [Candidatus Uhrbacteria bacterium]|nr:hypothetical protein [Candidatus Uhrbacteria bacterium]
MAKEKPSTTKVGRGTSQATSDRVAGIMSQIRTTAVELRDEAQQAADAWNEWEDIGDNIDDIKAELSDLLAGGVHIANRQKLEGLLKQLYGEQRACMQRLTELAPIEAFIIDLLQAAREDGFAGIRHFIDRRLLGDGESAQEDTKAARELIKIRKLAGDEVGHERKKNRSAVIEIPGKDHPAYLIENYRDRVEARYFGAMVRRAVQRHFEKMRADDQRIVDILKFRPGSIKGKLIEDLLDPERPDVITPAKAPTKEERANRSYGIGLAVDGLHVEQSWTRNKKWSGAIQFAIQPITIQGARGGGDLPWKGLQVWRVGGRLGRVISEKKTYLLPRADGGEPPVSKFQDEWVRMPSTAVKALLRYLRQSAMTEEGRKLLKGETLLAQIKQREEDRAKRSERRGRKSAGGAAAKDEEDSPAGEAAA